MRSDKPRVLVIDDDVRILDLFRQFLSQKGLAVTTAECGKEGLMRYAKDPFDLVLLDLRMPDIDGHEVLERIKDQDAQAKVIIMTGHDSLQSVIHAHNLGVMSYLTKPLDLDQLDFFIDQALRSG